MIHSNIKFITFHAEYITYIYFIITKINIVKLTQRCKDLSESAGLARLERLLKTIDDLTELFVPEVILDEFPVPTRFCVVESAVLVDLTEKFEPDMTSLLLLPVTDRF